MGGYILLCVLMDGQPYSKLACVTLSGKTRHAKCTGCILSSAIDCVDVDLCAKRPMLCVVPLLAGPYSVLSWAAAA